ncbi:MAG: sugar phosphate isomerase/epimerase [Planctomycetales bacterium]|nr:sugar phosphate isomerase/epimerase [Planctomycetales bacterium]
MQTSRRQFLAQSIAGIAAASCTSYATAAPVTPMFRFGLVTYMWGSELDVPALINACEQSGVLGVELRTTHAHGVEPSLDGKARAAVRDKFANSKVELVGIGSNERFDYVNQAEVKASLDRAKAFIDLSKDVGGSGVKVKGDGFHDDVPREQTLKQVIAALRELGDYGAERNQQIRLEVHGGFSEIPVHHEIISRLNHPNVRTCWNSNGADLKGDGLDANFQKLRPFFGKTAHVRQLDAPDYPWDKLIELMVGSEYDGWLLLEAHSKGTPENVIERLNEQVALLDAYRRNAVERLSN